jgi:multidrug efflux pump subunit AcrA (membrane-fusion protein)
METVRRIVFPIIWMVIFLVIALALGKLAFFSSSDAQEPSDGGASPTADYDEYATVAAETGDIDSSLTLDGQVQADDSAPLLATHAGEINKVWARNGDTVTKGQQILQVREEAEPEESDEPGPDADGGDEDGSDTPTPADRPQAPSYHYYTLVASKNGTVKELEALEGQSLELGDTVAQLSPDTYSIVADVTPEQQLQMLGKDGKVSKDLKASADLPTTKDPVECSAPKIDEKSEKDLEGEDPEPTGEYDDMTGEEVMDSPAAAQLRCPVAEGTTIVPGLSVPVTVDLGDAKDVVTVPTTAVEGDLDKGTVYTLDEDSGEPTKKDVTLGLRGEDVVEVTDGLKEGDEILQFVPGVQNDEEDMDGEEMAW